ncbi:hypothetical protein [Mesorhizobium sp. WSM3860]|nr:hypothetical protein [Mesorhizobium sp. WSM3860]
MATTVKDDLLYAWQKRVHASGSELWVPQSQNFALLELARLEIA